MALSPDVASPDISSSRQQNRSHRRIRVTSYAIELLIIVLWVGYIGRKMLNRQHLDVFAGGDTTSAYGRFFWDHVRSCGTCALWNGDIRGGAPAAIDINADTFHPIVAIPALYLGALDGMKITALLSLALGGIALWWLALELGLMAPARIASGMIGASGGYLVGRSQQGLVVSMVSIATAALIFPAAIKFMRSPSRRTAAIVGIVIGMAAISGQGYLQLAMIAIAPCFLFLITLRRYSLRQLIASSLLAVSLGVLIGGIFLFPFLRTYGKFQKEIDLGFGNYQPFRYSVLNLVIGDWEFYRTQILGKYSIPGFYINYLSWGVILFAVLGAISLWQKSKPLFFMLLSSAFIALWFGSGEPFKLLTTSWLPESIRGFGYGIRNPSFLGFLGTVPIIGLAGVGIDTCFRWSPKRTFAAWGTRIPAHLFVALRICAVLATLFLIAFSLRSLDQNATLWLNTETIPEERATLFLDSLASEELAWVTTPNSSSPLTLIAFDAGLKLGDGWRPWSIEGTAIPLPFRNFRFNKDERPDETFFVTQNDVGSLFQSNYQNQYVITESDGSCTAHGEGGHLSVHCLSSRPGRMTIQENDLGFWEATVNGARATVTPNHSWVSVELPSGESYIELRYRPWDFWVGTGMSVIGLCTSIILIVRPGNVRFHFIWRPKRPIQALSTM